MCTKFVAITFSALLLATAWADEAVCKVQAINKAGDSGPAALLQQKKAKDSQPYAVTINSTGYIQDHFITSPNTVAALEFLIGGRVGINRDTDIEIINERSIADGKTATKRVVLKKGGLWVKADAKTLKQPLEIQTNGGVMGIKGTEFTVETQSDGTDRVCCFESSSEQGGVEIRDKSGKVVGVAKPGEEYMLSLKNAPVVTPHQNIQQFREETFNRGFSSFSNTPEGRAMLSGLSYIPGSYGGLSFASGVLYGADAIANFNSNPAAALLQLLNSAQQVAGATGGYVNTGGWGGFASTGLGLAAQAHKNDPPKPDFPYDLSPDAAPESKMDKSANSYPKFSWHAIEDVESYAVVVSQDEKLDTVVFMDQTKNTQLNYPSNMRPLAAGKYFWRVIPLDGDDKPVKTASQTYFTVQ